MRFRKDEVTVNGYVNNQVNDAKDSEERLGHLKFRGQMAKSMTPREMKAAQEKIAAENGDDD